MWRQCGPADHARQGRRRDPGEQAPIAVLSVEQGQRADQIVGPDVHARLVGQFGQAAAQLLFECVHDWSPFVMGAYCSRRLANAREQADLTVPTLMPRHSAVWASVRSSK